MNATELRRYEGKLRSLRERLYHELEHLSHAAESAGYDVGEYDFGAVQAFNNEVALTDAEMSMREAVREALQRVEDGSYGQCRGCGEMISKARLDALPHASFCIQCERKNEG
ncbi:MAG: ral stress protein [Planctomycetota bacterium]|jgi:RNA polymerase-binding transcription factor DksA